MLLGGDYLELPLAPHLTNERPGKWPANRLPTKRDVPRPVFHGVASIDRVGDDVPKRRRRWFQSRSQRPAEGASRLRAAHQPGQVVGFWSNQYLDRACRSLSAWVRYILRPAAVGRRANGLPGAEALVEINPCARI
jgi:hypothetical protein